MVQMVAKIGIFLLSDDKDDKSIKKADVLLNKSGICFKSIKAKIYMCKIFKTQ